MATSDLAERLSFLFPTVYGPTVDTSPEAPDPNDEAELRRLVSLDLQLPATANELEASALAMFADLRVVLARLVLTDAAGAWQAVVRLLDAGRDREDALEQIGDVLADHVIEPLASGGQIDVEQLRDGLDGLGGWDELDEEIDLLPWMIDEWRAHGGVADDEIAGIVRAAIHPAILETIGDEVRTIDEVAAPYAQRLRLAPADASLVIGMYLQWFTNQVVVTARGNVARTATVLDGLRFRHVLTDAEAAAERLEVGTDLTVLFDDIDAGRLPDGSELTTTFRTAIDGPEHRRGSVQVLSGPPGWLGDAGPGDEVAVSRRGDVVTVERVARSDAPDRVRTAFDAARHDLSRPIDLHHLVRAAAVDAGGLGPDLGAPLSEILPAAGWSVRGEEAAASDHDWDAVDAEARRRGRSSVMAAAGVDEAFAGQVERLVEELFGPGRWFRATEPVPVRPDRVAEVTRLLGRPGVAGAVWTLGVGPDPEDDTAEAVLQLAQSLLDQTGPAHATGPARLAVLAAGQLDRVDLLPELLTTAAVDDSHDPALCSVAADVALDRGDVAAVRRHQRRAGLPPGELLRAIERSERSFSAGRNEPCPCGSGRKYKRCHGDVRPRTPTEEERARLLAARLDRHAQRRLQLTHRLAKRAGLVEDDEWWVEGGELAQPFLRAVTWFAGGVLDDHLTTRGALLPEADRELEEAWSAAHLVVGTSEAPGRITLADGREVDAPSGVAGSLALPWTTLVGWEVPLGDQPTFLFGAPVGTDIASTVEAFAGTADDPDAIARALGTTWRRTSAATAR